MKNRSATHCAGCNCSLDYYGFKWVTTDGATYCRWCARDIELARS